MNDVLSQNGIDTIALTGTPGRTASGSPTIELAVSYNGGQSYESTLSRSIGATTVYSEPILWQGLGSIGPPGLSMKFTIDDNAVFDVLAVRVNEEQPFRGL